MSSEGDDGLSVTRALQCGAFRLLRPQRVHFCSDLQCGEARLLMELIYCSKVCNISLPIKKKHIELFIFSLIHCYYIAQL